jgi:hypothetical protein
MVARGSAAEQDKAVNDRQELFSELAACLKASPYRASASIKIYIILHQSDEGDWYPVGTFTSRASAIEWASRNIIERLVDNGWGDDEGYQAEFLGDLMRLNSIGDYDEILLQASDVGDLDYMVIESNLFA